MKRKTKVPRKLKKRIYKAQIIMDVESLPQMAGEDVMTRIQNVKQFFNETGILLWDSYKNTGGNEKHEPKIVGCKSKLRVADIQNDLDALWKYKQFKNK